MMRRFRVALPFVLFLALLSGCAGHRYQATPEGQAMRRGIVLDALGQIGRPYRYGGTTPDGFDCSGLVQYVYGLQGLKLPRTAEQQHEQGETIDLDEAEPGDLLFYRFGWFGIDHVAIYLGDGQAVHAPASGRQVIVAPVAQRWWMDRYVDTVRIIH
jgi:cell wall-associated NlpC family hydrolase